MPDVGASLRGAAAAVGATAVLAAVAAAPARAAPVGEERGPEPVESIPAYDVVLAIDEDAALHVRETITYDFDQGGEHGIARRVPYRRGNRLFEIRDVRASSSTGAPARARTLRLFNHVRITVGERGRRVTGRQAYVIEYAVDGALTPRRDGDELVWDAVGTGWGVPIGEAAVRLEAPVPRPSASCTAGAPGVRVAGTACLHYRDGPYAIEFTQRGLRPGEGMVIRVRLPKGAVRVPPPRYAPPRWRSTWAGTVALAVVFGSVGLVAWRCGRGRPLPRSRTGNALVTCGALVALADFAEDVVPGGPWAFSLGDPALAGLATMVAGAGFGYAQRARRGEDGAYVPVGDYS